MSLPLEVDLTYITGSSPVVADFCEALGIAGMKDIQSLQLNIVAEEVVTLGIVKAVTGEELKRLAGVIGAHNLAVAGAGKVLITGNLIEKEEPVDPSVELRELASLLKRSTEARAVA